MIELLVVLIVLAVLAYKSAQYQSKKQEIKAYNETVQIDANALEIMKQAVERWANMNVDAIADDSTVEVPLSNSAYRNLLPPGFDYDQLPSGLYVRAFVRKSESYAGSGIMIPRAVIVPAN